MEVKISSLITDNELAAIFGENKADDFFEALYGDAQEGAYDIILKYKNYVNKLLTLEFHLIQRPDKCLVCNLTYGLPQVFSKHPIINIKEIVNQIEKILIEKEENKKCVAWELGRTNEISRELHVIPLVISIS
ncbi:MAG: pancreas/duodenum homeobox protein 1 [Desulfobacteraceae bacterium]|nr:pancreas/duodenum homeobox protein 1 [Desulfobacteraceae bacterium]